MNLQYVVILSKYFETSMQMKIICMSMNGSRHLSGLYSVVLSGEENKAHTCVIKKHR